MIEIGKIQGGKLLLKTTSFGEVGLLKAEGKTITNAIYWDTQAEAVRTLEKVLESLKALDHRTEMIRSARG